MASLPGGARVYRETPVFDEHTIPAGLRTRHATKPGVWARIEVLEGELAFRTLAPRGALAILTPQRAGVVAPEVPHEVEPRGRVRFRIAFLREDPGPRGGG